MKTLQKEHLSFREAAVRFNVSDNKVVKRWSDAYDAAGEAGRQKRKRHLVKKKAMPEQATRPPVSVAKPAEELTHDELRYLLAAAGMARSTWYYQQSVRNRPDRHAEIKRKISQIYQHHKGCYGYRRITAVLTREHERVSHKMVQRLMNEQSLKAVSRGKIPFMER